MKGWIRRTLEMGRTLNDVLLILTLVVIGIWVAIKLMGV
jgi:flagellar biogenesis protein FliO